MRSLPAGPDGLFAARYGKVARWDADLVLDTAFEDSFTQVLSEHDAFEADLAGGVWAHDGTTVVRYDAYSGAPDLQVQPTIPALTDNPDTWWRTLVPAAEGAWLGGEQLTRNPAATDGGFVARLRDDGSFDPGFGVDGVAALGFERDAPFAVVEVLELPSGRLAVGADGYAYRPMVALLEADGRPVTTFGTDGIVATGLGTRSLRALAADDQERLLVGSAGVGGAVLMRLEGDGTPDPTFGEAGVVALPLDGAVERIVVNGAEIIAIGLEDLGEQEVAFWARLDDTGAVVELERHEVSGFGLIDLALPATAGAIHEAWMLQCSRNTGYCEEGVVLRARF